MYQVGIFNQLEDELIYHQFESEKDMALFITTVSYKDYWEIFVRNSGVLVYYVNNREDYERLFNIYRKKYIAYTK